MHTIELDNLCAVTGGQSAETYPNENQEHIGGLTQSNGAPASDFTCWDTSDPKYRACVPTAELWAGRGNPWLIPKSYIEKNRR
jgi:hypothetical protein